MANWKHNGLQPISKKSTSERKRIRVFKREFTLSICSSIYFDYRNYPTDVVWFIALKIIIFIFVLILKCHISTIK